MVLENKTYVPTLAVRASEMNGLEFLPGATKDRLFPCFLLAPWANSMSLEKTISRIECAYPNRYYFLDIDRDYQITNLESPPQREMAQLLDPSNGFANWIAFVSEHQNVWPCVQSRGQTETQLRTQIEAYQQLGRPYCMRVIRERFPANMAEIISAFSASGSADFITILEGGWTSDPLTLAVWFRGVVISNLSDFDADVPVVLSCTSMPKMFTDFSADKATRVDFTNREMIQQVASGTNRARIVYGDWGSTRPRELGGFANRPLDRIDYPTSQSWYIARNKEKSWNFRQAADAIVGKDFWDGALGIWGEEMIVNTAINEELGINTPQKNVAARVNIHLHRQSFYGQGPIDPLSFDEEWKD